MTLTIITPTGARPQAFALCERYMARQTYAGAVRWIIVDDGERATPVAFQRDNWRVDVIRPSPLWRHGENTQGRNLLAGLDAIDDAYPLVTVVEDDDYYAPGWLERLVAESAHAELVGEGDAVYYNVAFRKWQRLRNSDHASLRATIMRGGALSTFRDVLAIPYRYYDLKLWTRHEDRRVFMAGLTVGIKGMPGRHGIALGHDGLTGNDDSCGAMLRELLGDDAAAYLQFYEVNTMSERKPIVTRPFRYCHRNWLVGEVFEPAKRIDLELHIHARKVEMRRVDNALTEESAPSRKMTVLDQETRMSAGVTQKTSRRGRGRKAAAEEVAEPIVQEEESAADDAAADQTPKE